VRLRRPGYFQSKASTRPAGERVTSLLVQRSNQENTFRASTPQEELHKGFDRDEGSMYNSVISYGELARFACRVTSKSETSEANTVPIWNDRVVHGTCIRWQSFCEGPPWDAPFDVLSFGYLSLHEQRKVTRAA
jgi:hypothetical protein